MIDLHYWPTPNGWKISVMLEECGLPYRVLSVLHSFDAQAIETLFGQGRD